MHTPIGPHNYRTDAASRCCPCRLIQDKAWLIHSTTPQNILESVGPCRRGQCWVPLAQCVCVVCREQEGTLGSSPPGISPQKGNCWVGVVGVCSEELCAVGRMRQMPHLLTPVHVPLLHPLCGASWLMSVQKWELENRIISIKTKLRFGKGLSKSTS